MPMQEAELDTDYCASEFFSKSASDLRMQVLHGKQKAHNNHLVPDLS